jgi:hypothetical protein
MQVLFHRNQLLLFKVQLLLKNSFGSLNGGLWPFVGSTASICWARFLMESHHRVAFECLWLWSDATLMGLTLEILWLVNDLLVSLQLIFRVVNSPEIMLGSRDDRAVVTSVLSVLYLRNIQLTVWVHFFPWFPRDISKIVLVGLGSCYVCAISTIPAGSSALIISLQPREAFVTGFVHFCRDSNSAGWNPFLWYSARWLLVNLWLQLYCL